MKKILLIILFIHVVFNYNIAAFGEIETVQLTLDTREVSVPVSKNVMWSGKEWLTTKYPPQLSADGVSFENTTGNERVKNTLGNANIGYFWTGKDYLVYYKSHDYRMHEIEKYLYRLSSDMTEILNTYIVPNWINNIEIIDGVCYISTENVYPVYASGTNKVSGERRGDFSVYSSNDFENWVKMDIEFDTSNLGYRPSMYSSGKKLIVADYQNELLGQYTIECRKIWQINNGRTSEIKYESLIPMRVLKCGELFYAQDYNFKENKTRLVVSRDGIYWCEILLDKKVYIENVYASEGNIVIKTVADDKGMYYCAKEEELYNEVRSILKSDSVYVKIGNDILAFDQSPIIEDGSTLVPMRFLFEQMGADVDWNGSTRTATATLDDTAVTFSIDNTQATVNKAPAQMAVPARLINGKTMVPLRFLSEELGFTVTWDEETRTAIIE